MTELLSNKSFMIGSLPHKEISEAFKLLNLYPLSIPTWPQFPKLSFKECMIPQYSEGFPGLKIDENEKKVWVDVNDNLINEMTIFFENVVSNKLDEFSMTEK